MLRPGASLARRFGMDARSQSGHIRVNRSPSEEGLPVPVQDLEFDSPVSWPSNGITEMPFRALYRSRAVPARAGADLQGADLELSVPRGRDPEARRLGRHHDRRDRGHRRPRPRRRDQRLCQPLRPSRQPLVHLTRQGNGKEITCIYHGWTYDLGGKLTGVAFERGVKRQGGMPPEFRKDDHRSAAPAGRRTGGPRLRHVQRGGARSRRPISGRTWSAASAAC